MDQRGRRAGLRGRLQGALLRLPLVQVPPLEEVIRTAGKGGKRCHLAWPPLARQQLQILIARLSFISLPSSIFFLSSFIFLL